MTTSYQTFTGKHLATVVPTSQVVFGGNVSSIVWQLRGELHTVRWAMSIGGTFPRLLGERLCLDFANTIEALRSAPHDFLTDYSALVRWGHHSNLLGEQEARQLLAAAARRPAAAMAAFDDAMTCRAAIQRAFAAIASGSDPAPLDLATILDAYLSGLAHADLIPRGGVFDWEWPEEVLGRRLEALLWPIARSAVELLTTGQLARVKQCAGPDGCGWLFYDLSKNASRRWCSMEGCGSQAKMRRYNARRRLARDSDES